MARIGLTDVFRYGSTFLGYFLVVAFVGGGLIAGGLYLADDAGVAITDPSVSSLTTPQAAGGAVIAVVGVFVTLAGLFGLAYKLAADGARVGVERTGTLDAAATAEGPAETSADDDDVATAAAESGQSEGTPEDTDPVAEPPTTEPPADTSDTATSTASDEGSPGARPNAARSDDDWPPTTPSAETDADATEEPFKEPWTEDEGTAADAGASTDEPGDVKAEPNDDVRDEDIGDGDDEEGDEPDPTKEWTPPDPSEFESHDSTDEEDEPEAEADAPTDSANDSGADGPVDGADATGHPDEDVADGEAAVEDETADPDDIPDDQTLADEGVEGFETLSEDDPLADRLPDE